MIRAYIGLGGNLGQPMRQLDLAVDELAALPECRLVAESPRYRTAPVGDPDQPEFINSVVALETGLAPLELLRRMQSIELRLGRRRDLERRWGPRTIDLDLLLYGDLVIDLPELQVPHPRLTVRGFVLAPLADLAPDLEIPAWGPVSVSLAGVDLGDVRPVQSGDVR